MILYCNQASSCHEVGFRKTLIHYYTNKDRSMLVQDHLLSAIWSPMI